MVSLGRFQCYMGVRFAWISLASGSLIFCLSALFLSFRYIAMTFFKSMGFLDIVCFCFSFFPRLILLSVSVGFIVGLSWYYSTLSKRNYLISMGSFGVSPSFFFNPTLGVVGFVSCLLFVLSASFFPSLVRLGKEAERVSRNRVDASFFVPRILFRWKDSFFYAHGQEQSGAFRGIFFLDQQENGQEKFFLSRKAFVQSRTDDVLFLLKDGQGVFWDERSGYSLFSFSEYKSFFTPSHDVRSVARRSFIQSIPSRHLWNGDLKKKQELFRRLTLPLFSLMPACFFHGIVWTFGVHFLWAALLGSVILCGIVWATSHQIYIFISLLFVLFLTTFLVSGEHKK